MNMMLVTLSTTLFCVCVNGGLLHHGGHGGYGASRGGGQFSGPIAVPEVLADGSLAYTPEVAVARAAHLSAVQAARLANPDFDDGHYDPYKYGDHAYGVVAHHEDISSSITAYQSLLGSAAAREAAAHALQLAQQEAALAALKAKTTADEKQASFLAAQAKAAAEEEAALKAKAAAEEEEKNYLASQANAAAGEEAAKKAKMAAEEERKSYLAAQALAEQEAALAELKAKQSAAENEKVLLAEKEKLHAEEEAAAAVVNAKNVLSAWTPSGVSSHLRTPHLPSHGHLDELPEDLVIYKNHLKALTDAEESARLWKSKYTHQSWS